MDPHYRLVLSADPAFQGPNLFRVLDQWPVAPGVWLLNGPDSAWIAPQADQSIGNSQGDYTIETKFDLAGLNPSTAVIHGRWAVDNTGVNVLMNGSRLPLTNPNGFAGWTDFTINSGFIHGINSLWFVVNNAPATPNPVGFRAEMTGTADSALTIRRQGSDVLIEWHVPGTLEVAQEVTGPWNDIVTTARQFTARLAAAPVISNPSFEADTFTIFPGYVSGNGVITGWKALGGHGVNPGTFGGPFTDNGGIPDGSRACFLQEDGALSQVVSGFIIGATYQVRYFENARNCCSGTAPSCAVKIGGGTIVAAHAVPPVGGSNPYRQVISDPFVATGTAMELSFIKSNPQGGDNTLLIDNVSISDAQTPPSCAQRFYRLRLSDPLLADCLSFTKEQVLPVFFENIHGPDSGHVWAVGNSVPVTGFGIIRFFDGQEWQTQISHAPDTLNDVFGFSWEIAWAVGARGLILSTCDGGKSWVRQRTPSSASLYGVASSSIHEAWAIGSAGTILHTIDSGQTWQPQVSGVAGALYAVATPSRTTAWVVGSGGKILRTDDGGANWTPQASGESGTLRDIVAISSAEAWVVGEGGVILTTSNSGQNWQRVPSQTSEYLQSITREPGGGLLAVGNKGTILRHGPTGWVLQLSPTSSNLGGVLAVAGNVAWAVSYDSPNTILGGIPSPGLWSLESEAPIFGTLWDAHGDLNEKTAWATGTSPDGAIVKSQDGGMTWRTIYAAPDVTLAEIATPNFQHVWAAGWGGPSPLLPGVVLHYDGSLWTRYDGLAPSLLKGIAAASPSDVWAVGGNSIFHTPDGGMTWAPQSLPSTVPPAVILYDVAAASITDLWAVGSGGVILRTLDGGQTWVEQPRQTARDLRAVSINRNAVWIVGEAGTILQFDGQTWRNYTGITDVQLNDVDATEIFGVWVAGANGTLIAFTNTGWVTMPTNETRALAAISVVATGFGATIWAAAWDGLLDTHPKLLRFTCR
ncbi:MAG TPA: YCF48-related protein [Verrucomicrobiae bacterium]|nr:YCF48-related protein [Verrucomicrobiae bacterium]